MTKKTSALKVVGAEESRDEGVTVVQREIKKALVPVKLVGITSLLVNNFSDKSRQQMEHERSLTPEEKREKRKAGKAPVVPSERFEGARILDERGRDCVHGYWVKAALVTACSYEDVGIKAKVLRGTVFVSGRHEVPGSGLIPIHFDGKKPIMRTDTVRVGPYNARVPDLRYRPEYRNWSLDLVIEYEPALVSLDQLAHLVRRAGTSVGLCEWRPEKSPAGTFGRFDIELGE